MTCPLISYYNAFEFLCNELSFDKLNLIINFDHESIKVRREREEKFLVE